MCAGLSGLPALFQLYILWPQQSPQVSQTLQNRRLPYLEDGNSFFFSYDDKKKGSMNEKYYFFSGSSVSSSPPATTSQLIAKTVMLESHSARCLLMKAGLLANPWLTLQSILYGEWGAFHKCQQSVNSQSYSSFEG